MTDCFYTSFENRHRGSRKLVKSRAGVYVPLLEVVSRMDQAPAALDLGCGRGEWLEMLREHNIFATGVDLDRDMLDAAQKTGLKVVQAEAVAYLEEQPDEGLDMISAFHLVEHIPFSRLQKLVAESLRVLKPGGILIMETPNPENLVVATAKFYMDPTHNRPIPPELLAFLPEFYGYAKTKVLRLQETREVLETQQVTLTHVIDGVSPDYAVVAQKTAEKEILGRTDAFFEKEYGISLDALAARYDEYQIRKRDAMENMIIQQAKETAAQAKETAAQAEGRAVNAEKLAARMQMEADQATRRADQARAQLDAMYASLSWRITRPLRRLKTLLTSWRRSGGTAAPAVSVEVKEMSDMPPTARRIYNDLKKAVSRRNKKEL